MAALRNAFTQSLRPEAAIFVIFDENSGGIEEGQPQVLKRANFLFLFLKPTQGRSAGLAAGGGGAVLEVPPGEGEEQEGSLEGRPGRCCQVLEEQKTRCSLLERNILSGFLLSSF